MKVFAISDLHMSINSNKPMNIFGPVWEGYLDKIEQDWREKIGSDDVVLLAGDLSWAMRLEEAIADLNYISKWPGQKVILKGNHDYWWSSISGVRSVLPPNMSLGILLILSSSNLISSFVKCSKEDFFDNTYLIYS